MAEWCGKPLAETRCALAPGHDGLCCTSTEVSLVAKCESLRSSLRAAEDRAEAAEFAAEGWENTARLNERKGAEWMQRAEAAERRAEGLEEALGRLEWSFRQTALRNGGTIYTAICCPACMGEKDPPDDKGPRRKRGDPLPLAGHKADCWLSAALARPRSEETPTSPGAITKAKEE